MWHLAIANLLPFCVWILHECSDLGLIPFQIRACCVLLARVGHILLVFVLMFCARGVFFFFFLPSPWLTVWISYTLGDATLLFKNVYGVNYFIDRVKNA